MTRHNPERTIAVKLSKAPKSSAYVAAKRGQQALPERTLRAQGPPSTENTDSRQVALPGVWSLRWYDNTRALLERHFGKEEPLETCAADLGLSLDDALAIVSQTIALGAKSIGLKFHLANGSNRKYPQEPKTARVKELAEMIARRLDEFNEKQPRLIEEALLFYIDNVLKNNRLGINVRKEKEQTQEQSNKKAPKLRRFLFLVRQLKIKDLSIRIIGFKVKGETEDLRQHLKLLKLSPTTPVHWVNAPNQDSPAALNHIAIDIVCTLDRKKESAVLSSEAFRYVMAIAAIARIWEMPENQVIAKSKPPVRANLPVSSPLAVQQSFFS